jgi:predicted regulator of Ras-like GTPase activity (Roadblock/LC7/MglB family)
MSDEASTLVWLIDKFVMDAPGVTHAVVVSADGLLLTSSDGVPPEHAEQLAALASGMLSLAQGSSRLFGLGSCDQTIVRMRYGHLFLTPISDGSSLAVLASASCDMKVIAYQMMLFVENAGHVLTPELRGELRRVLTR